MDDSEIGDILNISKFIVTKSDSGNFYLNIQQTDTKGVRYLVKRSIDLIDDKIVFKDPPFNNIYATSIGELAEILIKTKTETQDPKVLKEELNTGDFTLQIMSSDVIRVNAKINDDPGQLLLVDISIVPDGEGGTNYRMKEEITLYLPMMQMTPLSKKI